MLRKLGAFLLLLPFSVMAQEIKSEEIGAGRCMLGYRSTFSAFSDAGYFGYGSGGQFRILLGPRLNTEWYYDYISTDLGGIGRRADQHIGWSVMYYAFGLHLNRTKCSPYIEAGNCFDYTSVRSNYANGQFASRGSAAVHVGLGTHFSLGSKADLTLKVQYMLHIGTSVEEQILTDETSHERSLLITKGGTGIDGHLLVTCSVNFYVLRFHKHGVETQAKSQE